MEKKDFINKYKEIENDIDRFYIYSCLLGSGFEEDEAYDLIDNIIELWLKDESNSPISTITDAVYENYEDIDFENTPTRKILIEIL